MADWFDEYPAVIGVLIVAVSALLAFLLSKGLSSAVPWINRLSMRLSSRPEPAFSQEFSRLLQIVTFWGILLTGIILVLSLLGDG